MKNIKKIITIIFLIFLIFFILILIYLKLVENNIILGGSKDQHGCIPTAGYTWSFSRNECVRPFEHIKLVNSVNRTASLGGFIVISLDNESLDLYLPTKIHELLTLENEFTYSNNNSNYKVIKEDNDIRVFDGEKLIYEKE